MQKQQNGMQDKTGARIYLQHVVLHSPIHLSFIAFLWLMISSLSPPNILINQPHSRAPQPGRPFNPTSVSLDIRTPEELQAVNAFLLALIWQGHC